MSLIRILDAADPRIADYRNVPDPELLRRGGLFVAENRLVVRALLESSRFRTRSVLVTDAAREALCDVPAIAEDRVPVFVCAKSLMEGISGYNIYRGCLALGERPAPVTVSALLGGLPDARVVVALEAVGNADNVGAVFRNARAFAVDAVICGPACCDPLYRKAIRVSIGASLVVPYATSERPSVRRSEGQMTSVRPEPVEGRTGPVAEGTADERAIDRADSAWPRDLSILKAAGFTLVALTPSADAVDLDEFVRAGAPSKTALLVGHEGEGLSCEARQLADVRVRIRMAPGVDSLNVSTATGIALHRIFR